MIFGKGVINHVCAFSLDLGEQFARNAAFYLCLVTALLQKKKKHWELKDTGNKRGCRIQKIKQSIF